MTIIKIVLKMLVTVVLVMLIILSAFGALAEVNMGLIFSDVPRSVLYKAFAQVLFIKLVSVAGVLFFMSLIPCVWGGKYIPFWNQIVTKQ